MTRIQRRYHFFAFLFIAPIIILFGIFRVYPSLQTLAYSFFRAELLRGRYTFIGLENFIDLLEDTIFLKAVINTLIYVISIVPISAGLALIDAARIDGASEIRIVLTIVAPLIKTTLATVSMILFLNSWNDFLWPVIAIHSVNLRTIPVGIALFKDPYHIEYGPLMAATVISTAPMLIAYFLSQKYVIKGIALSGLKG